MKTTFIYFLKDPENPMKGYVGKTNNPTRRLRNHLSDRAICYRTNWISSLIKRGLKPVLEILDEVSEECWQQWEVAWIEFFREQGFDLVNGTAGGEAPPSSAGKKLSPEHRAKLLAASVGKTVSEETREKLRKYAGDKHHFFGKKFSPEYREKLSASRLGMKFSPEHCAKISASKKGTVCSEETRSKMSAAMVESWNRRRTKQNKGIV